MRNFCAKFRQILDIHKHHSGNLVNPPGDVPRASVVLRFSDLEVIALSLTAEAFGIDSENRLFHRLSRCGDGMPNPISRRQYDNRRKLTARPCEEIRRRVAGKIDGGENRLIVNPKPIGACKRGTMGRGDIDRAPSYGYCAS